MAKRCDSCNVVYINGVRCHETGCPRAPKPKRSWHGPPPPHVRIAMERAFGRKID